MCGFAGFMARSVTDRRKHEECDRLRHMTDSVRARGPDAEGFYCDDVVGLGHRRLSILDLTDSGTQPMVLRRGGSVIAYNGECYNFLELRHELKLLGHTFRGRSDTEVLLHVYDAWGLAGLKRLEGMFAFALWDPGLRRLVLMRDRLGVKPLYYGQSGLGLAFGSEVKAVLAAGGVDTLLDDQAFSEYLWYGNTHSDRTFYRGIRSILPGHWLIVDHGECRMEPWWRLEEWLGDPVPTGPMEDNARQLRDAIDGAVTRQLVSDVPVGIFLSGGVDSSTLAASATSSSPSASGSTRLSSFAAGFDFGGGVDELPKARMVANLLGLDHHEFRISGGTLPEVLQTLARAHDEPFADAANIPLYLMCRELGGQYKVVLQGDGGDELFGGYRRYAMLRNAAWWRLFPRGVFARLGLSGWGSSRWGRMADAMSERDPALCMALLLTVETRADPPDRLLQMDRRRALAESTDPFLAYRQAADRFRGTDPVQRMLLTDLTVQLPSQYLVKVDRATMAAGVEARVPLLDDRIARMAVAMPSRWKTRGVEKKVILRESQRGRLPGTVLDGPKTGFGVPYQEWLRTSLQTYAAERLLDPGFLATFAFDGRAVERAFKAHVDRRRERGFLLWKLLQLAIWKEICS